VDNKNPTAGDVFPPQGQTLVVAVILLAIFIAGAFWRTQVVANVNPFVDEYITIWAAMKILAHGYPLLASGNIYTHGIAHSYLVAGALALLGHSETVARLPGLLLSLITLPVLWHVGRKMFGWRAALLATLLLAMDPDAILWGGRARMYAFQQLCVLLAFYALYRSDMVPDKVNGAQSPPSSLKYRLGFALAYAGAVFNQGITALLLPVMGLLVLWRRGVRETLRWRVAWPFALAGASVGIVWKLDRIGLPAMTMVAPFEFVTRHRPTFQPALDGAGTIKMLAPYMQLPFAPLTALFLIGLFWYGAKAIRRRAVWDDEPELAYGYLVLLGVMLEMSTLVGHTWKSPRFLFMLLPIFYLIVSSLVTRATDWVTKPASGAQPLVLALLVAATVALYVPAAQRATQTHVWGYDGAFRWLAGQQQPGDVVLTINAPACAFVLGGCDYVAVEKGFEGYALKDAQGRWVGGWNLIPLLTSPEQLDAVLDSVPVVWFVVDRQRLQQRYTPAFLDRVAQRMEQVHEDRGALVFRSR